MNGLDDTDSTGTDSPTASRRRVLAVAGAATVGAAGLGSTTVLGGDGGDTGGGSDADDGSDAETRSFTVRLENVSDATTLQTTAMGDLAEQAVPLSPGVWAVHAADEPVFSTGEPERDNGLEELAEDGMPGELAESLAARDTVVASGAFATPVGADGPAPIGPGGAYEFGFEAEAGRPALSLSLVTMFVPSNDLFFALGGATGLPLFAASEASGEQGVRTTEFGANGSDGAMGNESGMDDESGTNDATSTERGMGDGATPRTGDVTDHVGLWDAGTEVNEEPGVGENQAQRQRGSGVGLVERGTVAPVEAVNGYDYPAVEDVLRLTLTPN